MRLEIVDLDDASVVADVELIGRGEIWFCVGELSETFGLPVVEFLAWPSVEELLTTLIIERGLTDLSETDAYFCQFVRVDQDGPYRGVWLSSPIALEFVGACRPVLRHRLQHWLTGRLAAERQTIDRRIFVEVGHGSSLH